MFVSALLQMGRSQPSHCKFLFYKEMPIAWQYVAQELQNQVSTSELLKQNTVEVQPIIAAESADTLHLLLWANVCSVSSCQTLCISTDRLTNLKFDLLTAEYGLYYHQFTEPL